MPKIYDKMDLYWTFDGDLIVGPDGDLYTPDDDVLRSLVQEVRTRIMGDQQDWELYPEVGAGLSDLIGEPNNKATAEAGKAKIIAALTRDGLVSAGDISIKYMPVGPYNLLYRLAIAVMPTDLNYQTESIDISVLFNYKDGSLHLV